MAIKPAFGIAGVFLSALGACEGELDDAAATDESAVRKICGDGVCHKGERCSCSEDCGTCGPSAAADAGASVDFDAGGSVEEPPPPMTVYFSHDAETEPWTGKIGSTLFSCGDPSPAYCWSEASSTYVTRQSAITKHGSWALRHEIPLGSTTNQTGKVIRHTSRFLQSTSAYYSAWYYLDPNISTIDNPDVWRNYWQWKSCNHATDCLLASDPVAGSVKIVSAFTPLDGTRRLSVSIGDCELSGGEFPQYDTRNWPAKWPGWGSPCKFANKANPTVIPVAQWFHVEMFLKACDPNRIGSQAERCSGELKVWIDGKLEIDLAHPSLNTLTVYGKDSSKPNRWSNNRYLYWGIGMYGDLLNSATSAQILYTDDAKITSAPVLH
jgi:hypothetical protein